MRTSEPWAGSGETGSVEEAAGAEAAGALEGVGHGHEVRVSLALRLVNFAAVLIPLAGLAAAVGMLWGAPFSWLYLALLGVMYTLTALGVTVGYHRLFTHRSFRTPGWVAIGLGVMGSMAAEGPLLLWVANHRRHHRHSDRVGDPHSPHTHGGDGVMGTLRGLWHAHMGWLLDSHTFATVGGGAGVREGDERVVADLIGERWPVWMSRMFVVWVLVGLLVPMGVAGVVTGSWTGAWLGLIWGGLVRVLLLHHVTWSINSVCHLWGTRPFVSKDESRNNAIFGVLAMGEGWHNNHHAFPTSARHGLRWWELDVSYIIIWVMSRLGMASAVRVPTAEKMASKRRAGG